MAQRQKTEVRDALIAAAAEALAEAGYKGMTLTAVAARAGTSVGNLYKYFADKEALFAAAVPPALAEALRDLLQRRVQALGVAQDVDVLPAQHPYRAVAEDGLRFAIQHRLQLLFLLGHAEDTSYAGLADELSASLTELAVQYAASAYPTARLTPGRRRALARIYRAFVVSITAILSEEAEEAALREAIDHLTSYHLAGLRAFFQTAASAATSRGP